MPRAPAPEHLFSNRSAQPLIAAATLAMWEALRGSAPSPALVAGYSIGELVAYGVAGALSRQDTVALAALRAELMDACLGDRPGQTMLAIGGLPLARAGALLSEQLFYVGIETGEDSCIAGGPAAAATSMERALTEAGGRCRRLPVEVASHTPYMAPAVAPLAAALQRADFQAAHTPVLAGIDACTVRGKALAMEQLSRQLAETIRWHACMDAAAEAGITLALELGPGNALSRMLRARQPQIDSRSVADFRTLAGIQKWLDR
jgi:[acyl-carrier-protein] S-malonyltransferase